LGRSIVTIEFYFTNFDLDVDDEEQMDVTMISFEIGFEDLADFINELRYQLLNAHLKHVQLLTL
jgi:hypothetical protein